MPNATEPTDTLAPAEDDVADTTDDASTSPAEEVSEPAPLEAAAPEPPAPPAPQPSDGALETAPRSVWGRPLPTLPPSGERRPASSSPPPATSSLGPAGKRRSPVAVAVLSVVTLGVYALVWQRRVNTEMADFDPRMHVRAGRSTLAVAVPWLIGLLIALAGGARITLAVLNVTLSFDPHFTVLQGYYLLFAIVAIPYLELIIAFSAIAIVMTLGRLRTVEDRVGITADAQVRPATAVWLLIVPVIGGLILLHLVQRRLNAVWEKAEPRPLARISQY